RAWFHKLDRARNEQEGKEMLDKELRRLGLLGADLAPVHQRFNVDSDGNLHVQLARCCQPVAGEPIVGYLTRGRGVSVHRPDCPSYLRLVAAQPQRELPVEWGSKGGGYEVDVEVLALDRKWLLKEVSNVIAQANAHVTSISSQLERNGAHVRLRV